MATPTRPLVRYHGGKWRLAPWIIGHFPKHRVYCEPFGGGGSVLLRKPRAYAEIYNDLDGEMVNLFRVVRDQGDELLRQLSLTPYAREEFAEAYLPTDDPIARDLRTLVKAYQGFGSNGIHRPTGFRANSNRSGTTPAHDWANFPAAVPALIERLQGVVIENRDALDCMTAADAPSTLHYVDPPYPKHTRTNAGDDYSFEYTDSQHEDLAKFLTGLSGMVVLSGYPTDLYRELGWKQVQREARGDRASLRTECLWLNPRAVSFAPQRSLEDSA